MFTYTRKTKVTEVEETFTSDQPSLASSAFEQFRANHLSEYAVPHLQVRMPEPKPVIHLGYKDISGRDTRDIFSSIGDVLKKPSAKVSHTYVITLGEEDSNDLKALGGGNATAAVERLLRDYRRWR